MRVADGFADHHSVQQNSLIMSADLFRHPQAGLIFQGNHDLHAYQPELFEGKARGEPRGTPRNPMTMTGRPHPVPQVAEMVNRVDAAQRTCTEKCIAAQDSKGIERALLPASARDADIFPGGLFAIRIRRP